MRRAEGSSMTDGERAQRIEQYESGVTEVERSLERFPPDKLTAHPVAGKWSAAEIVHHLADSETTSALRLRRLLGENNPLIQGYDQAAFARRLKYNERPIGPSLEAF